MVAISMYRGNLHRVPDVPRRWQIPPQSLTLRLFKSLLSRRLSRLRPSNFQPPPPADAAISSTSDPPDPDIKMEIISPENVERKKELEKKLGILNEKKHHLVQMLKQILNAEEEMKRRIMMQSAATRASVPFLSEASIEQGSVGRHGVLKLSVDVSTGIDPGGESELISTQHSQAHLQHVPCASPSSLGRPFHGSLQRSSFQSPRASSLSGIGNAQPTSNMLAGGGTMSASPRFSSGQQGTSANAISGTHI